MIFMKCDKTCLDKNNRIYLFNDGSIYIDMDDSNSKKDDYL